jgi:hypothetical protein
MKNILKKILNILVLKKKLVAAPFLIMIVIIFILLLLSLGGKINPFIYMAF